MTESEQRRGMLPEDLYRIAWAEDAQVSPDGRRVALVRKQMDKAQNDYRSNIWIAAIDGRDLCRFTNGDRADTHPRWSPDGFWLAFLSNRPGSEPDGGKRANAADKEKRTTQIWIIPASGGEARRLTNQAGGVNGFVWSPDSARIAFVARVQNGIDSPDDSAQPARIISTLRYKSNGEGFTYNRRAHISIQSVDGTEPVQLTDGDSDDEEPCWSPDCTVITYSSTGHEPNESRMVSDIYAVAVSGGSTRRLTSGTGTAHAPSYSPDGRRIAYYGHEDPHPGGSRNLIVYTMDSDGSNRRALNDALDRSAVAEVAPIWSADGRVILTGIIDHGSVALATITADDTGRDQGAVRIVDGPRLLTSWSASAAGTVIAYTASNVTAPAEAFAISNSNWSAQNPAGVNETRLTDFNAQWLAEVELSNAESFHFTSEDGTEIEGWVMPPSGYDSAGATAAVPALLNVHGGPHAFYGWGFFDEFQVQAGAGFAVVAFNPRGSQGYGEGFARACCGDWGGGDFADLMQGVDEALARFPFLDRARLGVLGGSYGGFMTSWIVGHTQRFKVAVSERAVNAPVSLFGTSDIGYWFEQYEVAGDPLTNRDVYLKHSPLTYAAQMQTPLLIVHSENDLRCPIEQGEQLFVALKLLGRTDTAFVRFPEENHELTRSGKPSRRVERFQILLDWFDRYLQVDRQDKGGMIRRCPALQEALRAGAGQSGPEGARRG
jgi:dipeptidyl aminopeptidase/acylaminoacyl peptidase